MNTRNPLCKLMCVSLILASAQIAGADPVGLVTISKPDRLAQSLGLSVCNVYVQFDTADDNLLYIALINIATDDPEGFYQHPFGNDTSPLAAVCDAFPEVCIDTFVTIGLKVNGGSDATAFDPDWNSIGFNYGGVISGGWFNANPPNGQGHPDKNLQVLVSQFTVRSGFGVGGTVTVFFNDGWVAVPASFECPVSERPFTSGYVAPPCEADSDCDDNDIGTFDECAAGQCLHTQAVPLDDKPSVPQPFQPRR